MRVAGYLCLNDVSARDLQFADGQWTRGKSLDTFCPVGPALVPAAEVPDPQALRIRGLLNGEALQDSSTANMIFSVAELDRVHQRGDHAGAGRPDRDRHAGRRRLVPRPARSCSSRATRSRSKSKAWGP